MTASKIKFDIDCLDIVIARNCQLNCRGCITFSDHNLVKGYTKINDSLAWLEFWSSKLKPKTLHLFGGEPLMHPELLEWVKQTNKFFNQIIYYNSGCGGCIGIGLPPKPVTTCG